ncbi:MAG: hypothetical protein HY530_00625 [Chloroflexi bacterium]|nr:hypothetical protein [Chloroflexota bacterium]
MKCSRCGRDITENESYLHQGQTVCEDCYMEAGLHVQGCDPWATFEATRARGEIKDAARLTETERNVYLFIRGQGKVTREQVKQEFGLSEAEMDAQLAPLMHSEMVKEYSEKGRFYLVPVS